MKPTPQAEAVKDADAVIFALPDKLIGKITREIIEDLKPGSTVVSLDPVTAYAEVIPLRDDLTYYVSHPCHPPMFNDEVTEEARTDWFGGVKAKHHIVSALHRGPEANWVKGDELARDMYASVMNNYRITVEQMAILEPALVETFAATCISAIKEAYDIAVQMGVPAEAAREFLSGHARIDHRWYGTLLGVPRVIACMDTDAAGEGAAAQLAALSGAVKCVQGPNGKDLNEFYQQAGENTVKEWLQNVISEGVRS